MSTDFIIWIEKNKNFLTKEQMFDNVKIEKILQRIGNGGRMKSTLIKDTTKQERIALIKEWIPADDGLEDCGIDLWEMYRDYIDGKREIAEINAAFQTDYYES